MIQKPICILSESSVRILTSPVALSGQGGRSNTLPIHSLLFRTDAGLARKWRWPLKKAELVFGNKIYFPHRPYTRASSLAGTSWTDASRVAERTQRSASIAFIIYSLFTT